MFYFYQLKLKFDEQFIRMEIFCHNYKVHMLSIEIPVYIYRDTVNIDCSTFPQTWSLLENC